MTGIDILFRNAEQDNGTMDSYIIANCLIYDAGSAGAARPQVMIHLPKADRRSVKSAWFEYSGDTYHVISRSKSGATAPLIDKKTPTAWDRHLLAERIY